MPEHGRTGLSNCARSQETDGAALQLAIGERARGQERRDQRQRNKAHGPHGCSLFRATHAVLPFPSFVPPGLVEPREPGNREFGTKLGRQKTGRKSNLLKKSSFFEFTGTNAFSRIQSHLSCRIGFAQKLSISRVIGSRTAVLGFLHLLETTAGDDVTAREM